MNNCGIYKIVNITNGKIYIGSSVDLKNRLRKHFEKLRKNSHENKFLQNSFNKYGEEKFHYKIIEYISDRSKLLSKEQYYIDKLKVCNRKYGYNILPTAGNNLGYKPTEETREKLRRISLKNGNKPPSQKGKKFSEEHKNKISKAHIGKTMPLDSVRRSSEKRKGMIISEETRKKISESLKGKSATNKKSVINLDTKEIFESMTSAGKSCNISHTAIYYCCSGKWKTAGGFRWSFSEDNDI